MCVQPVAIGQIDVVLTTIDGKKRTVSLQKFNKDQVLVRGEKPEPVSIETRNIQSFRFSNKKTVPGIHEIRLIDGSSLRVDEVLIGDKKVTCRFLGNVVTFSRRNVDWVAFDVAKRQSDITKQFNQVVEKKLKDGDRLLIARNGKIQPLDGVVRGADADSVQFQFGSRNADVKITKITGLKLYHASGRELDEKLCDVMAIDGSRLSIKTLSVGDGKFNVDLLSGDPIEIPANQVSNIDVGSARFAILSEMTPTSVRWSPLLASSSTIEALTLLNQPRFNKSFTGKPLSLIFRRQLNNGLTASSEKKYESGIAARAGSKIVYALGGTFEKLTGTVGFAPGAGTFGNLNLKIRGDGKVLFEQRLRAEDNKVYQLDIDITDVNRLIIDVEYLDGRAVGDELHFCDLKVSK